MNIASVAQQSFVGTSQQSSALAAVSPGSFSLNATGKASRAAAPSAASASSTGSSTTLASQTLQALMDLLQNDPAKPKHHHGVQPQQAANPAPAATGTAGGNIGAEEGGDSDESASLAAALGA